jgi:hypothetical protein
MAETFKTVIDEMTDGTDLKLVNLLFAENLNLIYKSLNTIIDEMENRWNIHLLLYDTVASRGIQSRNGWHSQCSWSFGIIDESHWYKTKNCVGWRIVTNTRIEFNLQVTATLGFHSLSDWCHQTMWLFSGAPEDPQDETLMEKHGANGLYSAVKSLMHGIRTEVEDTPQNAVHWMMHIAKPWTIKRWLESNLAIGKPLIRILKENAQFVDFK